MIQLLGPGGAGKSTVGPVLAGLLGLRFHDLDTRCAARVGDLDAYIAASGYEAYARANVDAYIALTRDAPPGVVALSSGFMTYPVAVNPAYAAVRTALETSPGSVVCVPSLDPETCIREIVRRQASRVSGAQPPGRAEAKIRARLPVYLALGLPIVTTMRPPEEIAAEVVDRLAGLVLARSATERRSR